MKLSEYAAGAGITYHNAWRKFNRGEIKGSKDEDGNIVITGQTPEQYNLSLATTSNEMVLPSMIATGSTDIRRNRAATIERTDKYANIQTGLLPYNRTGLGSRTDNQTISVQDAVVLCQFAYHNVSVFKSTVDLLTEFSASNVFLRGGTAKSRKFFTEYFKKINLWGLQDRFFRELWRSGNVFLYRFDGKLTKKDINTITQVMGAEETTPSEVALPLRYVVVNPAEVRLDGNSMFVFGRYCKVLNSYEIQCLKNPQTEEAKLVYESLPSEVKKQIGTGKGYSAIEVLMPLEPKYLSVIFNKKQDYEAFSTPTFFPVLSDINMKEELKKIDAAIARTMQQAVLLINMGFESKDGKYQVNTKAITEMQELFKNESVGRVLVSDFTTKASFIIPNIADILNKDKYEVLENDIKVGLGNVLMAGSDQKFANQSISVQVFMERLKHARQAFIQDFLVIEMKRVAKSLNFKSCPEPFFEEIDLKDEIQMARIYTQMAQLGLLTADETIRAIDSGQLPTPEESLESQTSYKKSRKDGLYEPLIGGNKDEGTGMNGRPPGSKTPQSTKNVSPIGQSKAGFSAKKVIELTSKTLQLKSTVDSLLLKKYKIKKLTKDQEQVSAALTDLIISNETPESWDTSIEKYIKDPTDKNKERVNKIIELAANYGVTSHQAAILLPSIIE